MSKLSNEQLIIMLKSIRDLQAQQKELDEQITYMQDLIKAHMTELGTEKLDTGVYRVSWKSYVTNRLDTSKLKTERADVYEQYLKPVEAKRFVIF